MGFRFRPAPFRRRNSFRDFSKLFQNDFSKTFRFSFSAPVPAGHKKLKTLPKCRKNSLKPLKCFRRDSTLPKPPRTSALFHNFSTFPQAVGFGRRRQFFSENLVENSSLAARPLSADAFSALPFNSGKRALFQCSVTVREAFFPGLPIGFPYKNASLPSTENGYRR